MKKEDWREGRMKQMRKLIMQADLKAVEEVKWKKPSNPAGIPVWYDNGILCTGETYKNHLRLTFAKGSKLKDPKGVLNAGRALVIHEEDKLNEAAFKNLIKEAVALNRKGKAVRK